jgi:hypothetical protein
MIQTEEIQEIKRTTERVINYHTEDKIKEANRLATATKRKEELGMLQTGVQSL